MYCETSTLCVDFFVMTWVLKSAVSLPVPNFDSNSLMLELKFLYHTGQRTVILKRIPLISD